VFELNLQASHARWWSGEDAIDVGDAVIVRTHRSRAGSPLVEAEVSIRRRTCCDFDEVVHHIAQRPYDDPEVEAMLAETGVVVLERQTYDPFGGGAGPTKVLWISRRK
jgi:hypothetical protein